MISASDMLGETASGSCSTSEADDDVLTDRADFPKQSNSWFREIGTGRRNVSRFSEIFQCEANETGNEWPAMASELRNPAILPENVPLLFDVVDEATSPPCVLRGLVASSTESRNSLEKRAARPSPKQGDNSEALGPTSRL